MKQRPGVLAIALVTIGVSAGCESGTAPPIEAGGDEEVVGHVDVRIDPASDRRPISSYIYGSNQDRGGDRWTVRRYGGNRLTGYNWENNFSNAGSDYMHSSDRFLLSDAGIPPAQSTEPARAVTFFHESSLDMGAESIVTLQMAGYVSRDDAGPVSESETAPSSRWVRVESRRNGPLLLEPDLTDDVVYMDELVHFLVNRFGGAASPSGVRWYSLDNEPALWPHTHPRIHPQSTAAAELVDRATELAGAVKDVDPAAEILGPVLYGMAAFATLQDASDWAGVGGGYDWFIDYYLDRMRAAELDAGRRLLDVLDVHWYPEARGDHRITDAAANTSRDIDARLQAPRTLWDANYREDSWIGEFMGAFLPLLPRLQQSIDQYYPGTRLAITEYNYGGGDSPSGGLAQVDVLGAFGRYGVHIATLWGIRASDDYLSAAFRLYRNYDGNGGRYGDTSVLATTSDSALTSVYAAMHGTDTSTLHVILLNKNREGAVETRIRLTGGTVYRSVEAWGFDGKSAAITRRDDVPTFANNVFEYVLPTLSALHLIIRQ